MLLSCGSDFARLVSNQRDDEHCGIEGSISRKVEALQPYLFEQSIHYGYAMIMNEKPNVGKLQIKCFKAVFSTSYFENHCTCVKGWGHDPVRCHVGLIIIVAKIIANIVTVLHSFVVDLRCRCSHYGKISVKN